MRYSQPTHLKPHAGRRCALLSLSAAFALVIVAANHSAAAQSFDPKPRVPARAVYVGTYTAPAVAPGGNELSLAEGIYVFHMRSSDGALDLVQTVPASNPSYLALDPNSEHLYCVHEDAVGFLSAFAIDPDQGTLELLHTLESGGNSPTHLSVHPSGQYLLVANCRSGNFPAYRIAGDGSIAGSTDSFQSLGNGTGANPGRQSAARAHQIIADPAGAHVFAVDLAGDRVNVLNLDLASGLWESNGVPSVQVASGSGPRHMAFHPTAPRAYVLNELVSTISVFDYDAERGAMVWRQNVSTLPADFTEPSTGGEIRVHPSGRLLFSTNRGHDSVAIFAIDEDTGALESLGFQPTGGTWPRGMNVDPSGSFLYVANQNSNSLAVFRIRRSGRLEQTALIEVPTPVDIAFSKALPD